MDPAALNYNPSATHSDGSCVYPIYGCMDPAALNYNPSATHSDGSCVYPIYGCMDPAALNYNPSATHSDGSCVYPPPPPPTANFTGHWWNGLTGTNERHWYLTQSGSNITGSHTSKDLFGTIFNFTIVSCTVSATNPLSATGTKQYTNGEITSANFSMNEAKSNLYYNNQTYTRI